MTRPMIRMLSLVVIAVAFWPREGAALPDSAARASHEASEGWHSGPNATSETAEVLSIVHNLNIRQIEAARLAGERGGSAELKAFARLLADEHARLDARVRQMASDASIDLDAARAANGAAPIGGSSLRRLHGLQGSLLDTAYLEVVVGDYRVAIQELEEEQEEGQEARVERLLQDLTRALRSRLADAEQVRRSPSVR